jgi:hypothetical protein
MNRKYNFHVTNIFQLQKKMLLELELIRALHFEILKTHFKIYKKFWKKHSTKFWDERSEVYGFISTHVKPFVLH